MIGGKVKGNIKIMTINVPRWMVANKIASSLEKLGAKWIEAVKGDDISSLVVLSNLSNLI